MIGVKDEETRHKLFAEPKLTLAEAVRICRSEEAATVTGNAMPTSGSVNAIARKSMYQRCKHATTTISSSATGKPRTMPACSQARQVAKLRPLASCKITMSSNWQNLLGLSIYRPLLKLQCATTSRSPCTVPVITQLATESVGISLNCLPDTGSDVDAIGPQHLEEIE